MEVNIDYPLKKVVKGSVVALIGSVVGMLMLYYQLKYLFQQKHHQQIILFDLILNFHYNI